MTLRLMLVAGIATIAALCATTARAEIVASMPATKVCIGPEGTGISLSVGLNHGLRPSRKLRYRVTLTTPNRVRVGFQVGTTGGYYDYGRIDSRELWSNDWYHPPKPGVYVLVLETRIDAGYPDVNVRGENDGPAPRPGEWRRWRPWRITAYRCG